MLEREHRCQSATLLKTNSLRLSTQNYLRETTGQTLATVIAGRTTAAAIPRFSTVAAIAIRKWSVDRNLEEAPIVRRVLRQNQRIEEYLTARPETVLLRRATSPTREPAFIEAPVHPQSRPAGMNASWQATTAQPAFNISQITDEVVRQLDSRLVAARERFGKI